MQAVASENDRVGRSLETARPRATTGLNRHERYEAAPSLRDANAQYIRLGLLLRIGLHAARSAVAAWRCSKAVSESPYLRLGYELGEAVLVPWGDCKNAVMNEGANDDAPDVQNRRRLTEVQKGLLRMGSLADRAIHAQIIEAKQVTHDAAELWCASDWGERAIHYCANDLEIRKSSRPFLALCPSSAISTA